VVASLVPPISKYKIDDRHTGQLPRCTISPSYHTVGVYEAPQKSDFTVR
jgi:hypothetical protein